MIRLVKGCLVREVETAHEAEKYVAQGYTAEYPQEDEGVEEEADGFGYAALEEKQKGRKA